MMNLGMDEMLFIAILALVLIGPKQLPEVARTLARFINDLKRSVNSVKDEFQTQIKFDQDEIRRKIMETNSIRSSNESSSTINTPHDNSTLRAEATSSKAEGSQSTFSSTGEGWKEIGIKENENKNTSSGNG